MLGLCLVLPLGRTLICRPGGRRWEDAIDAERWRGGRMMGGRVDEVSGTMDTAMANDSDVVVEATMC